MATERQQALCKNVSVFFAVLFLIGAIILSFATHLVASPMLCFATALFFYGLFVLCAAKGGHTARVAPYEHRARLDGDTTALLSQRFRRIIFLARIAPAGHVPLLRSLLDRPRDSAVHCHDGDLAGSTR